ncbi:flagellar hook-length control protein FliK [Roseivivax isoporae]|nr:flagellar hook-length control protein FliK [Roseivivax isoporae]
MAAGLVSQHWPAAVRQVTEAIAATRDGTVELRLRPEELGRIRVVMRHAEGTLSVQVLAERPETLELLRRHGDLLLRDLQADGFGRVDLNFGGGSASGRQRDDGAEASADTATGGVAESARAPVPIERDVDAPRRDGLNLIL